MRQKERHKTDMPVVVKGAGDGTSRSLAGHCVNLSEGGAGCIVSGKLTTGDFVLLELTLPHLHQTLLVSAQVRHSTRYYCGLAFVAPSESVTDEIRFGFGLPVHSVSEVRPHL